MQLRDVRVGRFGRDSEVAATIGDMRLWYRVPAEYADVACVDAFLVAALMPAMARDDKLEVGPDLNVSPRLLQSLDRIQDILHAWNPELKKVDVRANASSPCSVRDTSACFFSGGVDSTYTCLKHRDETTHLILLHGLDIAPENDVSFSKALQHGYEIAGRLGKTLIPVRTNAREFCNAGGLTMVLFHGALLASVALLLGFKRNYVAASHTYDDLEPWGSHAVLDPLWSTERSEIIYDGAEAGRLEKVRTIAHNPEFLDSLRVCANDERGQNCGKCEKCVRTMTELCLVGVSSPAFPPLSPPQLKKLPISFENVVYYIEACRFAQQVGDIEVASALRIALHRFEVRQLAKQTDAVLLGGLFRRLLDAFRRPQETPPLLRPITAGHTAKLRELAKATAVASDVRKRA